jgi:hypothetical protein
MNVEPWCDLQMEPWSRNASSEAQWDAILIGDHAQATSCPSVVVSDSATIFFYKRLISDCVVMLVILLMMY